MQPSTTTEEMRRLNRPRLLPSRPRSGNDRNMGAKMIGAAGTGPHAGAQWSTMRYEGRAYMGFFRSK